MWVKSSIKFVRSVGVKDDFVLFLKLPLCADNMAKQLLIVTTSLEEFYISKGKPGLVRMSKTFELFNCMMDIYAVHKKMLLIS